MLSTPIHNPACTLLKHFIWKSMSTRESNNLRLVFWQFANELLARRPRYQNILVPFQDQHVLLADDIKFWIKLGHKIEEGVWQSLLSLLFRRSWNHEHGKCWTAYDCNSSFDSIIYQSVSKEKSWRR